MNLAAEAPIRPADALVLSDFAANARDLPGAGLAWLDERRGLALGAFREAGMPHRRVEAWKYTDIANALNQPLAPATPYRGTLDREGALADPFAQVAGPRITLVNGCYDAALSAGEMPEGLEIADLGRPEAAPEWVADMLGARASGAKAPFGAAALALMRGGIAIRVARGTAPGEPLHLRFLAPDRGEGVAQHVRVLLILEEGARLSLIESHLGEAIDPALANLGFEIVLETGADLTHVRLRDEGEGTIHVTTAALTLAARTRYCGVAADLRGRMARLDIDATLRGEGAEFRFTQIAALANGAHADTTVLADHAVPHTASRQLFKAVVGAGARSVAQSKVRVRQNAMKSDSRQTARAMLMGPRAEADAKPELEIHADDVLCAHGAAIGELDADALFYLRARGISEAEARALLVRAFLEDAIAEIGDEAIRASVRARIEETLPAVAEGEAP